MLRRAHAPDDELPTAEAADRGTRPGGALQAADVQALEAVALFDPDQHIDIVNVLG